MQSNHKILDLIGKGSIVKMSPGFHTNNPYYVEILSASEDKILTNIPGHHSLEITKNGGAWKYHLDRMKYIGPRGKHKKLLHNQKLD